MKFLDTRMATALGAAFFMLGPSAWAQTIRDPALEALYTAGRTQDLHRTSAQRVLAQADDAPAVLGLALAALEMDETGARRQAIAAAEACVARQPRAGACHYALGVTLGVQAMVDGLLKAARSAGTVREALSTALEIDTAWYPARSALVEFYLLAPGVMGGSTSKATELAGSAPRPEQVQALQARVAMADRRLESAAQAFVSLPQSLEHALAADVQAWSVQAALGLINEGQWAKAQPLLERVLRNRPDDAGAAYAMGRARGEAGDHAQALKYYEQAVGAKGATAWPVQYRLGLTLEQLGRRDDAKLAFKRHINTGKGPKNLLEEARKRLEALGG
jgi:tetratricopeptide (TPR) repeat protein